MAVKVAFCGRVERSSANMFSLAYMAALQKPVWTVLAEWQGKRYLLWKGAPGCKLVFLDCGERSTMRARKYWNEADVRVVHITPEEKNLEQFVLFREPEKKQPFFLVGNYHGEKSEIKSYLKNVYRIEEENMGWLPCNNEYDYAFEQGNAAQFIRRYYRGEGREHNRSFFRELERSFFLLQKKLEEQENYQNMGGNHIWNRS